MILFLWFENDCNQSEMNINALKGFVSRILLYPIIRASIYYLFLLIAFFFLLIGSIVILEEENGRQVLGWFVCILGLIPVVFMIKFQGWFFPKTENSELKKPDKVLSRFVHTARSVFLLFSFYFLYLLCLVVFYLTHFSFIHHVLWYGKKGEVILNEWCPLGEHSYHLSQVMLAYIIFVPFALSLLSTVLFNHSNRIARVILFLLPIVGVVFFLFLSTRYSDEINKKARKSMSEAERKEYE